MRINGVNSLNVNGSKPVKTTKPQEQLSFGWFKINNRMYSDHFIFDHPERAIMPFDVETARASCSEPIEEKNGKVIYNGHVPYMSSDLKLVMTDPKENPITGEGVITAVWGNEPLNNQPVKGELSEAYDAQMLGEHIVIKKGKIISPSSPAFNPDREVELMSKVPGWLETHPQMLANVPEDVTKPRFDRPVLKPRQNMPVFPKPVQAAPVVQPEVVHTLRRKRGTTNT